MHQITAGLCSAVLTSIALLLNYYGLENWSGISRLSAILLSGLAVGMCQGFFVDPTLLRAIGVGAFFGMLALISPVVAATYGFALLSLPLLAGFAVLVYLGGKMGANFRISLFAQS